MTESQIAFMNYTSHVRFLFLLRVYLGSGAVHLKVICDCVSERCFRFCYCVFIPLVCAVFYVVFIAFKLYLHIISFCCACLWASMHLSTE